MASRGVSSVARVTPWRPAGGRTRFRGPVNKSVSAAGHTRPPRAPRPSRAPIRLMLVDDHVVFRAGLRALLEKQRGVSVVDEAGRGDEAVERVRAVRPDVVLMDLAMPGQGGLEATRRIVALGTGTRVLILTGLPQEQQLLDVLEAGA